MFAKSRFNPAPGILDFWNEFRKPNPLRWPITLAAMMPFALVLYWLSGETFYKAPEKPIITYITTFDPDRTDAEIAASNIANQEVKDLREAREAEAAERKRNLYKALGRASGMDVDAIEERIAAERAAEEVAEAAATEGAEASPREALAPEAASPEQAAEAQAESPAP